MKKFINTITFSIINLQLFADPIINVTTSGSVNASGDGVWGGSGLAPEMKTFYDDTLIEEASAKLVHDQFAQQRDIPANNGKTIEFRKFAPLNKALTPLTEGVTPAGESMSVSTLTSTVSQYGSYIMQTDVLELTALDKTILEATKLLGKQAGATLDTVTRNVLNAGTNVSYASTWSGDTETIVESRSALDKTAVLKVDTVYQVVAKLRSVNAPTIGGEYVAIIHPYAAYDLMRDPEWIDSHKYATPENLYQGEIGKIGGVRFVQSTEAKIFRGAPLTAGSANLTVMTAISSSTTTVAVKEKITSDDVTAFAARDAADKYVYIDGVKTGVSALVAGDAGSATLTLAEATASLAADKVLTPVGGAGDGGAIFSTLFIGEGAYGTTKVTGGGLETIVKQKGSAGTADPLNQKSSVGWKATKTAEILIGDYLVRVESCSPRYSATVNAN